MKNGKSINVVANFSYNMGIGKYSYKKNEVVYSQHHMPRWAASPEEFWQSYSLYDRANSSYKKIELSLQDELSLEENKKLLNQFLEKNIGMDYYHSVVIHEKDSSKANAKNIHAHIMICKRREDYLERNAIQFFSRYNVKTPELGGAIVDNDYWGKKKTLLNMRENWEKMINETFLENNIHTRVSCKSLKKQKEEALEKQDLILAECLDRPPIYIQNYILKKKQKTLTEDEIDKLEYYHDCKELRDLKNEVYLLRQEQIELALLEEEYKQEENNLFKEENFKDIYDLQSSIFDIALEKKVIEEQIANPILLHSSAIRLLNDEYVKLELQLETISKTEDSQKEMKIYEIESQMREIEETTKEEDISKKVEILLSELQENLQKINQKETIFFQELEEKINGLESTEETEKCYQNFQYKNWESNYMTLQSKRKEALSFRRDLQKIEKQLSQEQLDFSVYNSLTKGIYGKKIKELNGYEKQLRERKGMTTSEEERLEKMIRKVESDIISIKTQYRYAKGKNMFIRRKHMIKEKYYKEFIKIKNLLEKTELKVNFLKNSMSELPQEKQKEFKEKYQNQVREKMLKELIGKKNYLLRQKTNFEIELRDHNVNKIIHHAMTQGKSTEFIKTYNALDLKLKENISSKEMEEIKKEMNILSMEYTNLLKTIDKKQFLHHKDILYEKIGAKIKNIDIEVENIEKEITHVESLLVENVHYKGSIGNIKNFTPNYVKAELGEVLYAGLIHIEAEDKFEQRMKREMDFTR